MTSTPISLNDESLNGSWIDINSASQIHSPVDDDAADFVQSSYSLSENVQNLGLISFQVERFLQEVNRNQNFTSSQQNLNQQNLVGDDNSGVYMSDSDISIENLGGKALINSLREHQRQENMAGILKPESNNNDLLSHCRHPIKNGSSLKRLSKSGDSLADLQLSDSLSLISRASALGEPSLKQKNDLQDFNWLWDWTSQPEYFSGQEWKVYTPKQDYLMRQRQLYCTDLSRNPEGTLFSGEVISLLFLTNILSIIIGAGITYGIIMRKSTL